MPYKSAAQQRWAHTAAGMSALGGPGKVHEWDESTKRQRGGYSALPEHVRTAVQRVRAKRKGKR